MKKYMLWYCFCFLGYFFRVASVSVQALVKVPLCDVIGESCFSTKNSNITVVNYNNLPLCGQRIEDCPRMHQLLYNEIVTMVEERGDECLVKVSSAFYEHEDSSKKCDKYWALKKNFISFDELAKLGISWDLFPGPLDYEKSKTVDSNKKIVTLTAPFYEPITHQHYSAGTRFVMANSSKHTLECAIYLFDANTNKLVIGIVPYRFCHIENNKDTIQKKTADFIALLRRWILLEGFIPYVWGGSSYIQRCKNDEILTINASKGGYYYRPECVQSLKSGFDCAGLIARAAQICGLPYFFKNSITIRKNLELITNKDQLREGDIIWIPGHVMVVASLKNNTIIEARGYNHGYGKIHEIALNKIFYGVDTFFQLIDLYNAKKKLKRLDSKGMVAHGIDSYAVLSFATAFK